jgi:hypothetical protein
MSSYEVDAITFREFIVAKYKEECVEFDEDSVYIRTVNDFVEEWYSECMSCNIDRRFVNINELMLTSIEDDGYELYQYDRRDKKFINTEWDGDMAGWSYTHNKCGERVTEFFDCGEVFVAKYM